MALPNPLPEDRFFFALLPDSGVARTEISPVSHRVTLVPFGDALHDADVAISKEAYLQGLNEVIEQLKQGRAQKAVISRIVHLNRNLPGDIRNLFSLLAETYPATLTYLFRDSAGQLWMGATPEILFRKRGSTWETMALAGTVRAGSEDSFGMKEREEQSMVTGHILEVLREAGCTGIEVGDAEIVQAGPVSHLRTLIRFRCELTSAQLAGYLHPTPAVCGLPTETARQIIRNTEHHDRSYYTGYIGIDHPNGDADYFVNLRCMRIHNDHYSLYVGGGITAASDALSEWEETVLKSATLSGVIARSGN